MKKQKINFPPYWSDFSSLQFAQPGVNVLTERHVAAIHAAWADLRDVHAAKTKRSAVNAANAAKPRGQRVSDEEASARTLARRKAEEKPDPFFDASAAQAVNGELEQEYKIIESATDKHPHQFKRTA